MNPVARRLPVRPQRGFEFGGVAPPGDDVRVSCRRRNPGRPDGLWESEFDYWDRTGARRTAKEFLAACERAGITDPMETMTRRHWPAGPDWARTDDAPKPSWLDRPELPGIQRPSQLRELLGRP
jgi:hypothetical protein